MPTDLSSKSAQLDAILAELRAPPSAVAFPRASDVMSVWAECESKPARELIAALYRAASSLRDTHDLEDEDGASTLDQARPRS